MDGDGGELGSENMRIMNESIVLVGLEPPHHSPLKKSDA